MVHPSEKTENIEIKEEITNIELAQDAQVNKSQKKFRKIIVFIYGAIFGIFFIILIGYFIAKQYLILPQERLITNIESLSAELNFERSRIMEQSQLISNLLRATETLKNSIASVEAAQISMNTKIQSLELNTNSSPINNGTFAIENDNVKIIFILGLENAVKRQQPFQHQLTLFRAAFPNLEVSNLVQNAAVNGTVATHKALDEIEQNNKLISQIIMKNINQKSTNILQDISANYSELSWYDTLYQKLGSWIKITRQNSTKTSNRYLVSSLQLYINTNNWQSAFETWKNLPEDIRILLPNTKLFIAENFEFNELLNLAWKSVEEQKP